LSLVVTGASPARALSFDLTGGGDFGPTGTNEPSISATQAELTLELLALTMISNGDLPLTSGTPGTVFINAAGAGVKTALLEEGRKRRSSQGSSGISGTGEHQDEALILSFGDPVDAEAVVLTLTRFHPNGRRPSRSGQGGNGDAALLYVDSSSEPIVSSEILVENLVPVPGVKGSYTLALADLDLDGSISEIAVRATNGHFLVSQVDVSLVPIPEPATALLLASGLAALAGMRRRTRS
jgi:hypothetical protein